MVRSRAISVVGVAITTSLVAAYVSRSGSVSSAAARNDSAGTNMHHELRAPPAATASRPCRTGCPTWLAHLTHVPAQVGRCLVGVVGRERVEVGVERHLGVDDHDAAAGQPHDDVGDRGAVLVHR